EAEIERGLLLMGGSREAISENHHCKKDPRHRNTHDRAAQGAKGGVLGGGNGVR
ncbi:unnamed protein product, partial [Symbiodinium sp. CCMP2456]